MMPVSSVTVWAAVSTFEAAPVLNSATVPSSDTSWPASTVSALPVKTKMASDVACGSPSPKSRRA